MSLSEANRETVNGLSTSNSPLPLFRAEALLAPEKFYGDILLIRPFSFVLLACVATGIAAAGMCALLLVNYTERAHLPGLVAHGAATTSPSGLQIEAAIRVTRNVRTALQPGRRIAMRCPNCSDPSAQM